MIKFIDLFAGIGGFRLALESLGAKCVFSSEIDKYAIQTYQANFGDIPSGNITKIDANDIPDHDILCAGFPCPSWSIAGKRKGFEDSRGNLFWEIVRIAKAKQPKVLFLENVKGLLSHNKGESFKVMTDVLDDIGYWVYTEVLKASDFGLPQLRPRLYIVCFRKDTGKIYFEMPNGHVLLPDFDWPDAILLTKSVGSILEDNVDPKYTISDKLWLRHKNRKNKHKENGNEFGFNLVHENSNTTKTLSARYGKDGSEILINRIGTFGKGGQGNRLYSPNGCGITLTSNSGGVAANTGAYLVNDNPRKLTPRECARLMGFPDSFKIVVSDTQAYKQFGNSVAVPVIKAIGEQILKVIK